MYWKNVRYRDQPKHLSLQEVKPWILRQTSAQTDLTDHKIRDPWIWAKPKTATAAEGHQQERIWCRNQAGLCVDQSNMIGDMAENIHFGHLMFRMISVISKCEDPVENHFRNKALSVDPAPIAAQRWAGGGRWWRISNQGHQGALLPWGG